MDVVADRSEAADDDEVNAQKADDIPNKSWV